MQYKKFDLRTIVSHEKPTWLIPGFLIWKRRENILSVFPERLTRRNWKHLLDHSKTVRQHVHTKRGESNQHELEAIIRASYNEGVFDIQQYFVNRLRGGARFGKFINTVRFNGKNFIWNEFKSTKKEKTPVYFPQRPIKIVEKTSAYQKFLAKKRAKKLKKFIAFQNYLKRVGHM